MQGAWDDCTHTRSNTSTCQHRATCDNLARLDKKTDLFHCKMQPKLGTGKAVEELDEVGDISGALAKSNNDLPLRVPCNSLVARLCNALQCC